MRKAFSLFTVLIMVLLSLASSIFIQINNEKDNVIIKEKVLYGDKSYAQNIKVNFTSHYHNHLFWNTEYTISENPETKSEFEFNKKQRNVSDFEKSLSMYTEMHYSSSGDLINSDENDGLNKAYKELIENAEPYIEAEKVILVSDYYEYYPFSVDFFIPGNSTIHSYFDDYLSEADKEFIECLRSFFKIPVIEGQKLNISVTVDDQGNVIQSGSNIVGDSETTEDYGFYSESVATDDEFFIWFSNRTNLGNTVDTNEIPGGYGIYSFPLKESEEKTIPEIKKLKNIYPLEENNDVYGLYLSEDNKKLYAMIKENGNCKALVIDTDSYKLIDEILIADKISDFSLDYAYLNHISDDFIVSSFYDKDGTEYYKVFSADENGKFKAQFTVPVCVTEYNAETDEHISYGSYASINSVFKFDGTYLYLISDIDYNYYNVMSPKAGFNFVVYGKDGLLYHGEYDSSLSAGYNGYFDSSYYVSTYDDSLLYFTLPET